MLKILTTYLKPYITSVVLGLVVLFVEAIAELYLPNLMSRIVNEGMLRGDVSLIYAIGAKMLLVALAAAACAIFVSFLSSRLALAMGRDLRKAAFKKAEYFSLREFDSIGAASLITRITNDIVQVQQVVVMGFRFIVFSPILCVGGLFMAFSKDRQLSLVFAAAIPALFIVMAGIGGYVISSFKTMQKHIDKLNLTMRESLTGIRVIRAFNKMGFEKKRFHDANKDLMDVSIKVNKTMALIMPTMLLIMNFTSVSIIWFGGVRISGGQMDIGDMMAFIQYGMQIMMSVLMIAVMFVMIPRAQASSTRINEVLSMESEILDPDVPEEQGRADARGKVEFRNVSFKYHGSERPVLSGISFTAKAGKTTAIIGGTGAGKSTLISLIPRFYDAVGGGVYIDGVDVRDMTQERLREKIGFVPQSSILFSGTISDNIRFGKSDATDEEVVYAAKVAQAFAFVAAMPDTFDTQISQGGTNVSGGQKQRLCIARAIVRRPEIYVFDDSFSALDFKTDAALRSALKEETQNAAVIIVAQRVTSIMDADSIIVLDEGEVAGIGTHTELLESCEVYREICSSQLSEEELA